MDLNPSASQPTIWSWTGGVVETHGSRSCLCGGYIRIPSTGNHKTGQYLMVMVMETNTRIAEKLQYRPVFCQSAMVGYHSVRAVPIILPRRRKKEKKKQKKQKTQTIQPASKSI